MKTYLEYILKTCLEDVLKTCLENIFKTSWRQKKKGYLYRDHLRDAPREDIFKRSASSAASEFCEWVQVGIDVYILHRKYQVKPHSSPWFSAACAAAIDHRNHFFRLYQQNKSSESKVKFRQASNCCKSVLETAKLACASKSKESITSQKLGSQDI